MMIKRTKNYHNIKKIYCFCILKILIIILIWTKVFKNQYHW
jgi:hypothetical protein